MLQITADTFLLLALTMMGLQVKHFLADFPLQTKFMLRKSKPKNWKRPLLLHAAVHGALTALVFVPILGLAAVTVGAVDLLLHFAIDAVKARKLNYHPFHKNFWNAFGADQLFHQLCYVTYILAAVYFMYRT